MRLNLVHGCISQKFVTTVTRAIHKRFPTGSILQIFACDGSRAGNVWPSQPCRIHVQFVCYFHLAESRTVLKMGHVHDDVFKWKHFPCYCMAFCAGNSPVNFLHKGQWRGALIFSLNKRLSKHSWGWWFETPWRSLWRHCNAPGSGLSSEVAMCEFSSIFLHVSSKWWTWWFYANEGALFKCNLSVKWGRVTRGKKRGERL